VNKVNDEYWICKAKDEGGGHQQVDVAADVSLK